MAIARRCSICAIDWPDDKKEFSECPQCEGATSRLRDSDPLDFDEAMSLKKHAEFERFYEEWDAEHDPARLDPDFEDAPALA